MRNITVSASSQYSVKIGRGLLANAPTEIAAATNAHRLCIVSDDTVWGLYGHDLERTLTDAGFLCAHFTFPAGESSKNAGTYIALLEHMAAQRITRQDCIIALGGGVVGDLAGFAAATYLRGIDYIQIPTTLLAAVDSSVGGKTAIDLQAGKNLVGAFYQPKLVLCDTNTLDTLPEDIYADGCAEVIKYAVLFDRELFSRLETEGIFFDREAVIARCVELKRDVVSEDEFDRGQRMLLNLGHTAGHGIEAASRFAVSHGKAVAIGMAAVCRAASKQGLLSKEECNSILSLLFKFGLPVSTDHTPEEVALHAMNDKKSTGKAVHFIVPYGIGDCRIHPIAANAVEAFIKEGF